MSSSSLIENLARLMHLEYIRYVTGENCAFSVQSSREWDELDDEFRESNRNLAESALQYLSFLHYSIGKENRRPDLIIIFSNDDVEKLAQIEHCRWMEEKFMDGWRYGVVRDDERRLHPDLVPWSDLPDDRKNIDRFLISKIPELLRILGYQLHIDRDSE